MDWAPREPEILRGSDLQPGGWRTSPAGLLIRHQLQAPYTDSRNFTARRPYL